MLYTTLKGDTRFNAKNTHSHQKVAVVRVAVGVCQRKMKDKIAMLASMSNICQVSRAVLPTHSPAMGGGGCANWGGGSPANCGGGCCWCGGGGPLKFEGGGPV